MLFQQINLSLLITHIGVDVALDEIIKGKQRR